MPTSSFNNSILTEFNTHPNELFTFSFTNRDNNNSHLYFFILHYEVTEKVGFEPTAPCGVTGFQDQLLKPLGHLSIALSLHGRSHATIDILSSQKPNVNN